MAGQRMAGVDSDEVRQHNFDFKYRSEVNRLLELLHDYKSDIYAEDWQKANDLFDTDNEAGYLAWLELCNRGYARAAHSVGWCYRYGNGVAQDLNKAIEYYKRAIDGGYTSFIDLYWTNKSAGKDEDAINALIEGAKLDIAECYEALANECGNGNVFGGNSRVAAYLAARAYELDPTCSSILFIYYIMGFFFPVIYPYAKYCMEQTGMSKEEFEESGIEFPDFWDEIEPIEPKYPDFGLTLETCEGAVDPDKLVSKAKELLHTDSPDVEGAKPYIREAAAAGSPLAMYYAYYVDLEGCEDLLIKGADQYGDIDCIDLLAIMFSNYATYKIGNIYLSNAIKYWNLRNKLHGKIQMSDSAAAAYEKHKKKFDEMLGRTQKELDPNANAVLLRANGSYEKIKVDFGSLEGLYAPIGCDRINIISTQKLKNLSDRLGFTVVMYCDERGMLKQLEENEVAAELSGYDVIWGDVIICGFKDDCAPLYKDEVEEVCEMLAEKQQ